MNDEVLEKLDRIKVYPVEVNSDEDLAKEIARVANLAMALGYRLEDEKRVLTKEEAYERVGHSDLLFSELFTKYPKRLLENWPRTPAA